MVACSWREIWLTLCPLKGLMLPISVIPFKQLLQLSCGCDICNHCLSSPDIATEKNLLVVEADSGQIWTTSKRVMTVVAGPGSDSRFNQIRCSLAWCGTLYKGTRLLPDGVRVRALIPSPMPSPVVAEALCNGSGGFAPRDNSLGIHSHLNDFLLTWPLLIWNHFCLITVYSACPSVFADLYNAGLVPWLSLSPHFFIPTSSSQSIPHCSSQNYVLLFPLTLTRYSI